MSTKENESSVSRYRLFDPIQINDLMKSFKRLNNAIDYRIKANEIENNDNITKEEKEKQLKIAEKELKTGKKKIKKKFAKKEKEIKREAKQLSP